MKELILGLTMLNVLCIFMHEYDAIYRGEWRMFGFLRRFRETTQYLIFFYVHVPLTLFLFYYLWTVINFNNFWLWVVLNAIMIFHLIIHTIAIKWRSNVFRSWHSFVFIVGAALTGFVNLLLFNHY
jgi:hypothetical protein